MHNHTHRQLYNAVGSSWRSIQHLAAVSVTAILLSGCTGLQTFSQSVVPGDTVAIAIGWKPDVSRGQAVIVIQDSVGTQTMPATDPSVRAWINLYPDPVSRVVVGRETAQNLGVSAFAWGMGIDGETENDKDWFETVVFLDLPPSISPGAASVDVQVDGVSILPQAVALTVLPLAAGTPHTFETSEWGPLRTDQLRAMERANHHTVSFTGGSTLPAAIQLELTHDPDVDNGGAGQVYVIPPRGDIKSFNWSDSGTTLRVIITPAWLRTAEDQVADGVFYVETLKMYKFYIAGGITGLQITSVSAYDLDGNMIPDISAVLQ